MPMSTSLESMTKQAADIEASVQLQSRPYDICVYGVEGNPYFTPALNKLQDYVYTQFHPRPVRHLHIFTETVVTDKDGPTQLYVDQYSKKNHVSLYS